MKINEIVASQRRRLGLKQYQVAERTGIAPSQISIFERGGSGMVSTNLEKLFQALELHLVYDRQSTQQNIARECAQMLAERGIKDINSLQREEVAAMIGNEELLLLPVVSHALYSRYQRSELVDETHTWNYFAALVQGFLTETSVEQQITEAQLKKEKQSTP